MEANASRQTLKKKPSMKHRKKIKPWALSLDSIKIGLFATTSLKTDSWMHMSSTPWKPMKI